MATLTSSIPDTAKSITDFRGALGLTSAAFSLDLAAVITTGTGIWNADVSRLAGVPEGRWAVMLACAAWLFAGACPVLLYYVARLLPWRFLEDVEPTRRDQDDYVRVHELYSIALNHGNSAALEIYNGWRRGHAELRQTGALAMATLLLGGADWLAGEQALLRLVYSHALQQPALVRALLALSIIPAALLPVVAVFHGARSVFATGREWLYMPGQTVIQRKPSQMEAAARAGERGVATTSHTR